MTLCLRHGNQSGDRCLAVSGETRWAVRTTPREFGYLGESCRNNVELSQLEHLRIYDLVLAVVNLFLRTTSRN